MHMGTFFPQTPHPSSDRSRLALVGRCLSARLFEACNQVQIYGKVSSGTNCIHLHPRSHIRFSLIVDARPSADVNLPRMEICSPSSDTRPSMGNAARPSTAKFAKVSANAAVEAATPAVAAPAASAAATAGRCSLRGCSARKRRRGCATDAGVAALRTLPGPRAGRCKGAQVRR